MWVEKYRPKGLAEMVGNEEARTAVGAWLKGWKPGAKSVLLVGPPGTGKTTFVSLLAKAARMNIVDLNASDTRTKDRLNRRIGEAVQTVSLFGERSLIFLDEVDGLLGRSDYGGVEFIKESVKSTQNPIIMAANDPDADEIKKLGAVCLAIRFKPPPPREVELYLRRIAEAEGMEIDDDRLRGYVKRARGDIRNAINSLQSGGESHGVGFKDVSATVSQGLNAFFEAPDSQAAMAALKSISLPPIDRVRELYRCVLKASDLPPEKLARALEVLSRADMLMGKISRTREWRMLRYLDSILAYELQPVLRGESVRHVTEDLPFPTLLRIWNDSKKVKELALRYAARAHTSATSARTQDVPYIFALSSKKTFREELERVLDLDETFDKFLQKEAGRS